MSMAAHGTANLGESGTYLTVRQVATQCGVRDRTVQRWISTGRLQADRHEGRSVVTTDALNTFLVSYVMPTDPSPDDLTVEQVAAQCQVDTATARRWFRTGLLVGGYRATGGSWRISREAFVAFATVHPRTASNPDLNEEERMRALSDLADVRGVPLKEVERLTGIRLWRLHDLTRGRHPLVEHQRVGSRKFMTEAQIHELVKRFTKAAVQAEPDMDPDLAHFLKRQRQAFAKTA